MQLPPPIHERTETGINRTSALLAINRAKIIPEAIPARFKMVLDLHDARRRDAVVRQVAEFEGHAPTESFGVVHVVDDGAAERGDQGGFVVAAESVFILSMSVMKRVC